MGIWHPRPKSPTEEAYRVLLELWTSLGSPPEDVFYPVNEAKLRTMAEREGWHVDGTHDPEIKTARAVKLGHLDVKNRIIAFNLSVPQVATDQSLRNQVIAHEIGHALLDTEGVTKCNPVEYEEFWIDKAAADAEVEASMWVDEDEGKGTPRDEAWKEVRAHEFAREVLMPKKAVKRQFRRFFAPSVNVRSLPAFRTMEAQGKPPKQILRAAALDFAIKPAQQTGRSLADFFEVRPVAMARRLMQVDLFQL